MDKHNLPFEVGQVIEMRCFMTGFRGAWFRCKILDIRVRSRELCFSLAYCDFPDQEIEWTKVYEKQPSTHGHKPKENKREIMMRPSFPRVYRQSQFPDSHPLSEELVVARDIWKIGDLVDWWTDNCYWSGRVTCILNDEKVKVELPPPPIGEGKTYIAFSKDLRPSLNWSPDDGWTVPSAMKDKSNCAWLLKPLNRVLAAGEFYDFAVPVPTKRRTKLKNTAEGERSLSISSPNEKPPPVMQEIADGKAETSNFCRKVLNNQTELAQSPREGRNKLNTTSELPNDLKFPPPQPSEEIHLEQTLNETLTPVIEAICEKGVKTNPGSLVDHSLSSPSSLLKRPSGANEGNESIKKRKVGGAVPLNCIQPDDIDASVLKDKSNCVSLMKLANQGDSHDFAKDEGKVETSTSCRKVVNKQTIPVAGGSHEFVVPAPREGRKDHKLPPLEPSEGQPVDQSLSFITPNETMTPVMQAISEKREETKPESLVDHSVLKQTSSAAEGNELIKKRKIGGGIPFDCIQLDTIEAVVVDMEELLNRIKRAKKVLEAGTPSNTTGPTWEFVDPLPSSSAPK